MMMRKILSLITVIAFFSPLTSIVSSCSEKKLPYIPPYPIKGNKIIPAIIIPDIKTKYAMTLVKTYSSEKKVLDNPLIGDKTSPLMVPVGSSKQILPSEWKKYPIIRSLNLDWSQLDGLVKSLFPCVFYKPVKIIYNQPTLCEMYLPILGFTKDHPRPFYIEGI